MKFKDVPQEDCKSIYFIHLKLDHLNELSFALWLNIDMLSFTDLPGVHRIDLSIRVLKGKSRVTLFFYQHLTFFTVV